MADRVFARTGNFRSEADGIKARDEFLRIEAQSQEEARLQYERAISFAEHKQLQRLLAPPKQAPPEMHTTQAAPVRENPRVIDFEGRAEELKRQAELIQQKFPVSGKEAKL